MMTTAASVRATSGLRLAVSTGAHISTPLGKLARHLPASGPSISSLSLSSSSSFLSSSSSFSSSSFSPSSSSRTYTTSCASRLSPLLSSSFSSSLSRRSRVTPLNPAQIRTMASDGKKIKVQNPVVELDGDEVCLDPGFSLPFYIPYDGLRWIIVVPHPPGSLGPSPA